VQNITGLVLNEAGWWYVENGKINASYVGLVENEYGWWYVKNGTIDFNYTGFAKNENGWWYVKAGGVVSDPTEKNINACLFALKQVGKGYSQEKRWDENYFDCSSLAYRAWKSVGVDISYGGATTAAEEARGLAAAGKSFFDTENLQMGDLIFYSSSTNGRYMNITHVAIYVGNGMIVDARGKDYGVVYRVLPKSNIVLLGRPM